MSRTLVERYWAAQDPMDPATLLELRHPGWTAAWPQSGELVASHDADVAIHSAYPGYPSHQLERVAGSDELWRALPTPYLFTPVRISGASDIWIVEGRLEYPEAGVWSVIASLELRDGLVGHEAVYYCRTFESAPWPATYPEQATVALPAISASMEHDEGAERRHLGAYRSYIDLAGTDPGSAARALFDAAAIIDRPQARRRVSGLDAIALVHAEQRSVLPGRLRRVLASGDVLVAEAKLLPAETPWFQVTILEFDGDKVVRGTEYLAESFEPPAWRRAWIEPLPSE